MRTLTSRESTATALMKLPHPCIEFNNYPNGNGSVAHKIADCRNYRAQIGLLGSSHFFFSSSSLSLFTDFSFFFLFQFTVRASTTRRKKILAIFVLRSDVCVYVIWTELQNLIFVLSREMLFFAVFIARKEGQSFVQLFFFFILLVVALSRLLCAFYGGNEKRKLAKNMSQNHHNLITSFFLEDYNYSIS